MAGTFTRSWDERIVKRYGFFGQRLAAAAFAISARRSGVIAAARAEPPSRPISAAAGILPVVSAVLNLPGGNVANELGEGDGVARAGQGLGCHERKRSFFAGAAQEGRKLYPPAVQRMGAEQGHITKLKMIKRQMYGRANLDLLRARLCAT
jgi:hypothetical protein